MNGLPALLQGEVLSVLITFARVAAVLMVLPGFGEPYVLGRARLMMALTISLLIALVHGPVRADLPTDTVSLVALVGSEVVIGLFIGATVRLVLVAAHLGGAVIAMQSGLASAAFFDPMEGTQGSGIGNFLTVLTLALIFVTEGHHAMLRGLWQSYAVLPQGALPVAGMAETFSRLSADAIAVAFRLAAPMLLVGVLTNLLMGVLNRLMPTFQVMFVVMPLQIALAFAVLMISLGVCGTLALGLFRTSLAWLDAG